jgi:hypothetical protein
MERLDSQHRLEMADGLLHSPALRQHSSEVASGADEVGFQLEREIELGKRGFRVAELIENDAEKIARDGRAGRRSYRRPGRPFRVVQRAVLERGNSGIDQLANPAACIGSSALLRSRR